ncbi:MAG TPA: DUF6298 domain-containing protein [Bacteroidales bacterium]|jgi:hypothetical protein|nr:DUF6298 domain-containing protein [Bacteroidales bacterium]
MQKKIIILILLFTSYSFVLYSNSPESDANTMNRHFNGPLKTNPNNPNYFIDNSGKAKYLTGSHTWANFQEIGIDTTKRFDYENYLKMMEECHHNFMRLWMFENSAFASWTPDTIFWHPNIYQRSGKGKAGDGGTKFDLTRFNQYYFDRLRQRIIQAGNRGIYVSVMLFQGWSLDKTGISDPWRAHPWNKNNNINGIGARDSVADNNSLATIHSMRNPKLLEIQEQYIKKVIETVNDLDNVLYEVSNEGGDHDWQEWVINLIREYEKSKNKQHAIGYTTPSQLGHLNKNLYESSADWVSPTMEPLRWAYPGTKYMENYMDDPPANKFGKINILDTDHLWGHGGNWKWVWKSFTRGYNPIFMDPWQPIEYHSDERVSWVFTGGVSKDNRDYPDWHFVRTNMGYARKIADSVNLIDLFPEPDIASTGYCLTDKKNVFIVYLPNGGDVTINMLSCDINANYYIEWFFPILNRSMKINTPVKGGGYKNFTLPFTGDGVLILIKN